MNEWAVKYMIRWVLDEDQGADPGMFLIRGMRRKEGLKWKFWENCEFIHVKKRALT